MENLENHNEIEIIDCEVTENVSTSSPGKKKMNKAVYVFGSLVLTAAATYIVPKVIDTVSTKLYIKKPNVPINTSNEWGEDPVKITK